MLKRLRVRYPDGSTDTLGAYLKTLSNDQLRDDVITILDTTIERMRITDDRRVLTDMYAIFLSLQVDKKAVIDVGVDQSHE